MGILILAVPISVISSNFSRQYKKMEKKISIKKEENAKRKEIQEIVDKMVESAKFKSMSETWTAEHQAREESNIRLKMYRETMVRAGNTSFKLFTKAAKEVEIANKQLLKDRINMICQEYLGGSMEKRFTGDNGQAAFLNVINEATAAHRLDLIEEEASALPDSFIDDSSSKKGKGKAAADATTSPTAKQRHSIHNISQGVMSAPATLSSPTLV